jgi:hypothetical protein
MWTMLPVREFTIVRTSFNLSPQDGQVFFVSLSKTATTSARNNSMARSVSKWIREYTLGSGNTKEIFWSEDIPSGRCLSASRMPWRTLDFRCRGKFPRLDRRMPEAASLCGWLYSPSRASPRAHK